eukprot:SM000092S24484  [mRNA]  locus=s92:216805:228431:+ [translate_table: standard]
MQLASAALGLNLLSDGKEAEASAGLDFLAGQILRKRMRAVYSHLSSGHKARANAALLLLAAVAARSRLLARELVAVFDFTLAALLKLAAPTRVARTTAARPHAAAGSSADALLRQPTRASFVAFVLAVLGNRDAAVVRSVLQKRSLLGPVLQHLAADPPALAAEALLVVQQQVLAVDEAVIPRGLQGAVFGDGVLDQLARISSMGLEGDVGMAAKAAVLAHDILLAICTEPAHGVCPPAEQPVEQSGGKSGSIRRLLRLALRLKATEHSRHAALLLAAASAQPALAAAFINRLPYSLEPRVSPRWFAAISLVGQLITIASEAPSASLSTAASASVTFDRDSDTSWGLVNRIVPPALPKAALSRGLQHQSPLVKYACLGVLLQILQAIRKLFDHVHQRSSLASPPPQRGQAMDQGTVSRDGHSRKDAAAWLQLERELGNCFRAALPDPQVLLGLHAALEKVGGASQDADQVKAGAKSEPAASITESMDHEEGDGSLVEDPEVDADNAGRQLSSLPSNVDPESGDVASKGTHLLRLKLLQVLGAYQRALPEALAECRFDPLKLLPADPGQQNGAEQAALTSLLLAAAGEDEQPAENGRVPSFEDSWNGSAPLYQHLLPIVNLMLSGKQQVVCEGAWRLAFRTLLSTGGLTEHAAAMEAAVWLDCLPSGQAAGSAPGEAVASFLAKAVASVGRNPFRYASDVAEGHISALLVCALGDCFKVLKGAARSPSAKAAVAIYVAGVLHSFMDCQADDTLAKFLVDRLGTEPLIRSPCTEWRPLQLVLASARRQISSHREPKNLDDEKVGAPAGLKRLRRQITELDPSDERDNLLELVMGAPPEHLLACLADLAKICSQADHLGLLVFYLQGHRSLLRQWPGMLDPVDTGGVEGDHVESGGAIRTNGSADVRGLDNLLQALPLPLLLLVRERRPDGSPSVASILRRKAEEAWELAGWPGRVRRELHAKAILGSLHTTRRGGTSKRRVETMFTLLHCLLQRPPAPMVGGSAVDKVDVHWSLAEDVMAHQAMLQSCSLSISDDNNMMDVTDSWTRSTHLTEVAKLVNALLLSRECQERMVDAAAEERTVQLCEPYITATMAWLRAELERSAASRSKPDQRAVKAGTRLMRFAGHDEQAAILELLLRLLGSSDDAAEASLTDLTLDVARIVLACAPDDKSGEKSSAKAASIQRGGLGRARACRLFQALAEVAVKSRSPSVDFVIQALVSPHQGLPHLAALQEFPALAPATILELAVNYPTATRGAVAERLVAGSSLHRQTLATLLCCSQAGELRKGKSDKKKLRRVRDPQGACSLSEEAMLTLLPAIKFVLSYSMKPGGLGSESPMLVTAVRDRLLAIVESQGPAATAGLSDFHSIMELLQQCLSISPLPEKDQRQLEQRLVPDGSWAIWAGTEDQAAGGGPPAWRTLLKAAVAGLLLMRKSSAKSEHQDDESAEERTALKARYGVALMGTLSQLYGKTPRPCSGEAAYVPGDLGREELEDAFVALLVAALPGLCAAQLDKDALAAARSFAVQTLRCRYEAPGAMRLLGKLLAGMGQCFEVEHPGVQHYSFDGQAAIAELAAHVFDLAISHSNFLPTLLSNTGLSLNSSLQRTARGESLPSLLALVEIPQSSICQEATTAANTANCSKRPADGLKFILISLLRTLFRLRISHIAGTPSDGAALDRLQGVLLAGYSATMQSTDRRLLSLLLAIDAHAMAGCQGLAGWDYLWGEAALRRLNAKTDTASLDADKVTSGLQGKSDYVVGLDPEAAQRAFVGEAPVEPQQCGLTVVYFPQRRSITQTADSEAEEDAQLEIAGKAAAQMAYDPAFLLAFTSHALSHGRLGPRSLARLGLLQVALASLSAADEELRKLAYDILAKCMFLLEEGPSFKERPQLRLLLTQVKNSILEPNQRVPTVCSTFFAEAACVLMHPDSVHYTVINKALLRKPALDLHDVPVFYTMFNSGSPSTYRAQRVWILRLLCASLVSSNDGAIFRRRFVLELLQSFYGSALCDVMRKAVTVRKCAVDLVENAGLIPWLAQVASEAALGSQSSYGQCDSLLESATRDGKTTPAHCAALAAEVLELVLDLAAVERRAAKQGVFAEICHSSLLLLETAGSPQCSPAACASLRQPTLRLVGRALSLSQRRRPEELRLNLRLRDLWGLVQLAEADQVCYGRNPVEVQETHRVGLEALLQCSPPAIHEWRQDGDLLLWIAEWATAVALMAEEALHVDSTGFCEPLLRWLAASILLSSAHGCELPLNQLGVEAARAVAIAMLRLHSSLGGGGQRRSLDVLLAGLCVLLPHLIRHSALKQIATDVVLMLARHLPPPAELHPQWQWSYSSPWVLCSPNNALLGAGTPSEGQEEEDKGERHLSDFVKGALHLLLQALWLEAFPDAAMQLLEIGEHGGIHQVADVGGGLSSKLRGTIEEALVALRTHKASASLQL